MKNILLALLLPFTLAAQRTYEVPFLAFEPRIDGVLDSALNHLPVAEAFTTSWPTFGQKPTNDTQVRMAYTKQGVYIYAECLSQQTRKDFTRRDEVGQADYFSVGLDTWHDGQNAFVFTATPAGQRVDQRITSTDAGEGFDASWKIKTKVLANRWAVEMFVAYGAIRFPNGQEREWGVQFTRFDRSTGQLSTWNPQDPLIEDQVLQYGVLTGLKDAAARFRVMGTLFCDNQMNFERDISPNRSGRRGIADTVSLVVASDMKLSWDNASSLDISILPDVIASSTGSTFVGLPMVLPGDGVVELPYKVNRPINEQDRGLLDKSNGFRDYVFLKRAMADPRHVGLNSNVQMLNRTQYATRFKNNWGVAVRNELFRRFNYRDVAGNRGRSGFTNHHFLAIEKALPNNSWVHFSNSFYRLSDQRLANQVGGSTQLRDRTNRYEVKASSRLQTQTGFSVADLSLSVGRINSAVIYGATYDSPTKTRPHLLVPMGLFVPQIAQHRATLYWGKRDYTPKTKKWQNAQFLTQLDLESKGGLVYEQPVQWRNRFTALDRHFRQWEASSIVYPLGAKTAIRDVDIIYYLAAGLPLGFSVGYTSDSRRRAVTGLQYESLFFAGTNQMRHQLGIEHNVVISRFLRANFSTDLHYAHRKPFGQNILLGPRQVEFANVLGAKGQLGADFHTGNRLSLIYRYRYQYVGLYNRRLYTAAPSGVLEPSGYTYIANPSTALLSQHELGLNWLTGPMSVLRFSWAWGKGENFHYVLFVDDASEHQQAVYNFNLSIVVNLNAF